jgi:hypothetical protein
MKDGAMATRSSSLERLAEEVQNVQYRDAAESYCRLLAEKELAPKQVMRAAIAAAAPYVQVPSHVMRQPNGDMRGVNYDHSILGWRGAIALAPHLPGRRPLLASLQAMWYAPQGLNVWDQILCDFPGHYANAEQCGRRFPEADGSSNRFDGPAWRAPKVYFEAGEPISSPSADEGLEGFSAAITEGDREQAYGLFLGLAENKSNRKRLKERLLLTGIMDVQDTLINRTGYQNIGHKAIRARAMIDLADYLGWDEAGEVMYTVVPDLGCSPRLHGLWNELTAVVRMELPNAANIPKRGLPLTEPELDELTDVLLWGEPAEVNRTIIDLYRRGRGMLDIGDGIAVCYQAYLVDVLEHPSAFNYPMHSFDYLNVVNTWLRDYENAQQVKGPFMSARFVNDAIRFNAMYPRDPAVELAPRSEFRAHADAVPVNQVLQKLLEAILQQDAPLSGAMVDSYLERTSERRKLMATVAYAACHFQNDPHILRNCTSSIEEFNLNQTPRRDDILRGFVKHQARYVKRSLTREAFNLYGDFLNPTDVERSTDRG